MGRGAYVSEPSIQYLFLYAFMDDARLSSCWYWLPKWNCILQEKQMLNELQFNLTVPTPYVFLVRFLKAADSDTQVKI
jgi:hypothetical protein